MIPYNWKFGSKELQETGFYDFGARMYMPDITIFGTHDPLSEKTLQPYAYAYNNPIKFADPTGMEGEAAANDDMQTGVDGDVSLAFGVRASDLQKSGAAMNVYNYGDSTGTKKDDSKDKKSNSRSKDREDKHPYPVRKYLKNKSNFNSLTGIQTTEVQYQLDHANTLLEFRQITAQVEEAIKYADKVAEWTGGITSLKNIFDLKDNWKKLSSASTGILMVGGTIVGAQSYQAGQFLDMYKNVQSNYLNMHSKNPSNMKGVTVNRTMIIGPQNHIWSQYSFYDIATHRYLGGGTFQ